VAAWLFLNDAKLILGASLLFSQTIAIGPNVQAVIYIRIQPPPFFTKPIPCVTTSDEERNSENQIKETWATIVSSATYFRITPIKTPMARTQTVIIDSENAAVAPPVNLMIYFLFLRYRWNRGILPLTCLGTGLSVSLITAKRLIQWD
jgi:hypothetical protein